MIMGILTRRPGVGERIRHLRLTLLASAAVAVIGAVVGWLTAGGTGALGVVIGVALVAASYTATTLAVAWADSVNPQMVLAVGMGMYITKFSLLGAVLIIVGASTWAGKIPMAMGIVAGVVVWTAAQIWWTRRHEHPYTPRPVR
jgi:hypothetical protein